MNRKTFPIFCLALRHSDGVKVRLIILLLLAQSAFAAESLWEKYSGAGQLILTQFLSAPFPHPSRADGYKYKEALYPVAQHYTDSTVAIFIPKGFREKKQVDFVIHFHGWQNDVEGTLQGYQLIEQLVASGRNAVLVVPEGPKNAPDSSGGKLENTNGFKNFIAEAIATLKMRGQLKENPTCGDIILSGHSGGYRVISSIVERGGLTQQVKEVWLFDALYGQSEKFLAWSESTAGRLVNIYTDGGGTKIRTEEMMATLKQQGENFFASTDQLVTSQELKTNKFIFLHTDLSHNNVVARRKTFQQFLESSCLEPRLVK